MKSPNITSFRKLILLFIASFFFLTNFTLAQSLYNLENSEKYAKYLLLSKQYHLAAEEYERLVFLDPSNIEFKIKLLQSYRNSQNFKMGLKKIYDFKNGELNKLPENLAIEYLIILLHTDSGSSIKSFLQENQTLSNNNKSIFKWCNTLISRKHSQKKDELNKLLNDKNGQPSELIGITKSSLIHQFKNPLLASSLSAVIPGLGKVYTKNYTDGIISLLFIAGTAWQSYRGFKQKGVESIGGWIYGSISFGFYIGNIYGSAKAAKRYNKLKINDTNNKIYNFIQSYNF